MKKRTFLQRGFTLLELLVVISIIAILIALGTVSYTTAQKKSRDARRQGDIKAWGAALEQYYADNTAYPANCDPGSTYLQNGVPHDPKYSGLANDYSGLSSCYNTGGVTRYCLCAAVEGGGGNKGTSGNGTNGVCGGSGTTYYCISNQQ